MPDEAKLKLLRRSKRCQVVKHGKFYLIGRFLNYLIQPIWYIHIVWKLEKNVQIFVANNFGESGENVKSKFLCNFFFRQMCKVCSTKTKVKKFNVFPSNQTLKNLFTFGLKKFKISRQIGKWKICLHFRQTILIFFVRSNSWKNCLHSAWKENSKFLVKLESEKFVYIFDR